MLKHTQEQAASVVAITTEQGGGTFFAGTLEPFRPDDGFAVAVGGAAIPAGAFSVEVASWLLAVVAAEYRTQLVGTWLHEGRIYVDAVRWFPPEARVRAELAGKDAGQLAIFDFATGEDITL